LEEKSQNILIVDDERGVLSSLRRLFLDEPYEIHFATNGQEGLELLRKISIDLVISDFRMPVMDGVAFLREVRNIDPRAIRVLLSGYADAKVVAAAFAEGCVLQFLPKPWNDDDLRTIVRAALEQAALQRRKDDGLQRIINSISSLPSMPDTYLKIREILSGEHPFPMDAVAVIIEKDVSLAAELMRWANSAVFGQRSHVDSVRRALVIMGSELLQGVVLTRSIHGCLQAKGVPAAVFDRDAFRVHSLATAVIARRLMKENPAAEPLEADRAFTAGLLHDIGKLVEASFLPDRFTAIMAAVRSGKTSMTRAEIEILGTTHEEIGGHLAEWWSMPAFLVGAARWHHKPGYCDTEREIVAAVHVADALAYRFALGSGGSYAPPEPDESIWNRFSLSEERLEVLKDETAVAVS
jgi:HD-like signal output (HDOD) protein